MYIKSKSISQIKKKVITRKNMYLREQMEKYFYLKTANKPRDSPFLNYFNNDV